MSSQMCCPDPGCKNKKLVVLDTSLLVAILGFLCQQYVLAHRTEPVVRSFDDLCSALEYFLNALRACTLDGYLHVSTRVLDTELSPLNPASAVRARVPLPDRLTGANRSEAYARLNQLLGAYLTPTDIADEFVAQLHATYEGRPLISDEDMSLLGVAILKSEGLNNVGVLSLDEDLLDWALAIRSLKQITFEGSELSTIQLAPENGLTFLSTTHDCCGIETSHFQGLTEFVESQDIARIEQVSDVKVARKWREFQKIKRFLVRSAVRKEQQRLAPA